MPRLFFPSPQINLDILYTAVLCQSSSLYDLKSITKVALDLSSLALSVERSSGYSCLDFGWILIPIVGQDQI